MPTEQLATFVTMWVSETNSNFKTIVCEESSQSSTTANVTTTKTKCQTFTSVDTPELVISGSGVAGANLNANQVSFKQIQAWAQAKNKLYFIRKNEADTPNGIASGEIVYLDGQGYFSEATETSAEGDVIKFNWSFTVSGDVDNTADS